MYILAMYIQVDAFHVIKTIIWHLHIYAFPEACQQFYHTSKRELLHKQFIDFSRILYPFQAECKYEFM
jgi:hypothetical protein